MKLLKSKILVLSLTATSLALFYPAAASANASPDPQPAPQNEKSEKNCTYAREYITTLEYLRSQKNLVVPEIESRQIAQKVSLGCTGAAKRFIKVVGTLAKASVSSKNTLELGTEFAERTDAEVETFVSLFLNSFSADELDLDAQSSLKIAKALTSEFHGDVLQVKRDFEKLVAFCISHQELALPRPECASFATRITKLGEKFHNGISESFIKLLHFLTDEGSSKSPHLTTGQALKLAEKVAASGQEAPENFMIAYRYGVSESGLGVGVQEAIDFAKQMANPSPPRED